MMFVASKLLAFVIQPLFWVLAALLGGLLLARRRPLLSKRLTWAALFALLLGCWAYLPSALLLRLESRHAQLPPSTDMRQFTGVVVLGGALARSDLWTAHNQVALNDSAERMTAAVGLARKYPHLQLLFTGGIASLPPAGLTEAVRARKFFDEMGVDASRVLYEAASRNTLENASLSAVLAGVDPKQRWLLLTSAYHMPRSMGVFTKAGWNVTPYPVDYRTDSAPDWYDFSLRYGPELWELALHETLGYWVYRLVGKI